MKYFIDFEFIEGFHKPLFGKNRHFIDLISVGIVAEDGREYYAISNQFHPKDADKWVVDNVISKIELEWIRSYSGDARNKILDKIEGSGKYGITKIMQKEIGKHPATIGLDIREFCGGSNIEQFVTDKNIQFYGYYSDYDWVLFCSLFGRMIDLPKGFPMYCIDLKQILDEKAALVPVGYNVDLGLKSIKMSDNYPKEENEHNALADARWIKKLHDFLQTI